MTISSIAVAFVACHGGPADHFATFAEKLTQRGYEVQIYASGPALKKFQDRHIEMITPFSLENGDEVAKSCAKAKVVITDVGHVFDITLHQALAEHAPNTLRMAYYDNPESYVPGGYSEVAAKVMLAADRVLFANANLAQDKDIGIGYYPIAYAEKIAKKRATEREALRAQLFAKYGLKEQKVLVYAGGNNEEYYSKAFPAFLQFVSTLNLSDVLILHQQHPGAKEENLDGKMSEKTPGIILSDLTTEEALIVADAVLYYQTSMGPQFALADIPTIQVGHQSYEDILVRNRLCAVATSAEELRTALTNLQPKFDKAVILQGLGIRSDWADRLESAIR